MTHDLTLEAPRVDLSPRGEVGLALMLSACFGTVMLDRMEQLFLGPYLVADLHLTGQQIGLLAGAVSICWAASTLLFGIVSDRIGRKRVLIPAMVLFSLLSAVSGLTHTFGQLLLVRALLGLAEGPCWCVIMALMEECSSLGRRGRNIGIVVCAGSLVGSAFGPVFATQIAEHFGWRAAFFAAAIPGLLLAALVYAKAPEPRRRLNDRAQRRGGLSVILKNRGLWLCFCAALLLTVWIFAFNAFAPLYLTQKRHMSPATVGLLLGLSGLGGFLYCLAGPSLSDRIGRRPTVIMAATIALALPVAFLIPHLGSTPLGVLALVTSSGTAIAALIMVVVPMELAPPALAATAVGFVSIGGDALGATIGPVLGGWLANRYDLSAPLVLAAISAALIAVIGFGLPETGLGIVKADKVTGRPGKGVASDDILSSNRSEDN